jgi:hypothetical protein
VSANHIFLRRAFCQSGGVCFHTEGRTTEVRIFRQFLEMSLAD